MYDQCINNNPEHASKESDSQDIGNKEEKGHRKDSEQNLEQESCSTEQANRDEHAMHECYENDSQSAALQKSVNCPKIVAY